MKKLNEIYKCVACDDLVEIVRAVDGDLICCGQPMEKLEEKSGEEGMEKHKPVVENQKVLIGSVPHPMLPEHHIEWIEVFDGDDVCRKNLTVDDKPEAEFCNKNIKTARAFCNIHGLWKN